jgi:16S rRNA (cytosine967-C5)-methyltransferase
MDPRAWALRVLMQSERSDISLDLLMDDVLHKPFEPRDRHLLHALVYGVLRNRLRLDSILSTFLHQPMDRIDSRLMWILRIGLFQILEMDRIPHRAAVHTAVELTRTLRMGWAGGMVNAVLRRAIREASGVPLPSMGQDPVRALAVRASFPQWLIEKWIGRYGVDETQALCDAFNRIPPLVIRTNTLRTTRDQLMRSLADVTEGLEQTCFSPDGIRMARAHAAVFRLSGFSDGHFQVQDEAAQVVSLLVDPRAGMRVLDACAGRGGKTGHLAQMMNDSGEILAVDQSMEKLSVLQGEMKRLGVSMVRCQNHAWTDGPLEPREAVFDRILVDAPCSGLGVLGRNPDIRWRPDRKDLRPFTARQVTILENTLGLLKPGGRLIYAVCSMEPEETDGVIETILQGHPEIRRVEALDEMSGSPVSALWKNGALRTSPHLDGMDGFFAAVLTMN